MIERLFLLSPATLLVIVGAGVLGGFAGAFGYDAALWVRGFSLRLPAHLRRIRAGVLPFRSVAANSLNLLLCFAGSLFFVVVLGMATVELDTPYWAGPVVGLLGAGWVGGGAVLLSGWLMRWWPSPVVRIAVDDDVDEFVLIVKKCPFGNVKKSPVAMGDLCC